MRAVSVIYNPEFDTTDPEWCFLGDTGYWCRAETIRHEIRLAQAVEALQGRSDTLRLPAEFVAQRRQKFLEEVAHKTAFEEAELQARTIFEEMAVPYRLTVLTGPPGAAKTTVAAHWVRTARQHNPYLPIILITSESEALHRLQDRLVEAVPDLAITIEDMMAKTVKLPKYACYLIDEAGLIDTKDMAFLLEQAVDTQAVRVVLIGDDKQLLPEGIGQPFRWIRETKRAQLVELPHSFRQKTPLLRQVITDLYYGHVGEAINKIDPAFILPERMVSTLVQKMQTLSSDKALILFHGEEAVRTQIKSACPSFRVLTVAEAQGLAFDQVVFVVAQPIDLAAMLVGCSRERYQLDVFVDEAIYPNKPALIQDLTSWRVQKMALDILPVVKLLEIIDER